ncbi:MAG: hypothetical protein QXI43_00105 [Candidatus Nitrosocaldus sp.]
MTIRTIKSIQPYVSISTANLPVGSMYKHYSNLPLEDYSSSSSASSSASSSNSNHTITLPHYVLLKIPTFNYTSGGGAPYALEKYHYIAIVMPPNAVLDNAAHAEALKRLVTAHINKVARLEDRTKIDAITIAIFAHNSSNNNNSSSNNNKAKLILGGRGSLLIFVGRNLHDQVNKFAYILTNFYAAKIAGLLMKTAVANNNNSNMNKAALKTYLTVNSTLLVSNLLNNGTLDLGGRGGGMLLAEEIDTRLRSSAVDDSMRNLLIRLLICCSSFSSLFKNTVNIVKAMNEEMIKHIIDKLYSNSKRVAVKASMNVNRRYLAHLLRLPRLLDDLLSLSSPSPLPPLPSFLHPFLCKKIHKYQYY